MFATFNVGSKCAIMLPRKFINPQITPAKGMVINRLVDHSRLILVEEVWQFKGLNSGPLKEMCTSSGRIKSESWGWQESPKLIKEGDYIILPVRPRNLMEPDSNHLEAMIKKSIGDFKALNGFV